MRLFILTVASAICIVLICSTAKAQVPDDNKGEEKVEETIENITESTEEELDFSEFIELFEKLKNDPINLNKTNAEQLKQLPFLNDIQIFNLLEHIRKNGNLASIYELQSIEGFDQNTIEQILPYVIVSNNINKHKVTFSDLFSSGKNQLFIRYARILQEQKGFSEISDEELAENPNARYLGSPDKLYTRYRYTYYNFISFGVTGEKDAGEHFFGGTQPNGYDFYSAHFWMKDVGFLKTLAIGDYQLYFGQGLGLWTGLGFGKSSDVATAKRNGRGIMPYSSVDENRFLRGAAASYAFGRFEVFGFYSLKNLDASMQSFEDTIDAEEFYVSSLTATGFHRTPGELEKKDVLKETLYGGRFEYRGTRFYAGATVYQMSYDHPLGRNLSPYNQFEFNGQQLMIGSADYGMVFRNMNVFGEVARSDNGGLAYMQGMIISPASSVSIGLNYRNFSKDYQSIYTGAFSEGSKVANEQGLYAGIEARLHSKWTFNGYMDVFSFPWLRYRVDAPSHGHDVLTQLTYRHSKTAMMYFRYRQKYKFLNGEGTYIDPIVPTEKCNYRIHAQYGVSPSIVLKTRIEFVTYRIDGDLKNGFLMYQDMTWRPKETPWAVSLRYAVFDTDSYDERLYAYENDVLYAYSIPAYYYRGSRAYVLVKYSLGRNVDIWLRYAQTFYDNKTVIGSGLDEIQGRVKSEVKAQVRIKF